MSNYKEYTVKVCSDYQEWRLNSKLHREDGPAIEYADGHKEWWFNGMIHREDGPAIECTNGNKYWYLNDKRLTEKEFLKATKKDTCEGKVVEVKGTKYKLVLI